ncbi:MAG: hypothetical protein J1F02_01895 [Lachnospiraceae bacterium]|nr:hypothetical protein [Lachnospiraceae bacterium]
MKNSTYFPFERNRYFYGKLLSVDDFELEQRYMNDKRRLLNRFLHGTGVAAGLYVVQMDEQTLSVETGFALDNRGREIVIDTPVICRLSLLDGFEESCSADTGYVYLCLEYNEEETERVHNISGTMSASGELGDLACNKIREGYRLYLTNQEPEQGNLSAADLYQESQVIYQSEEIKITQVMPRYIQAGGEASLHVRVENLGRSNLSFSYNLVMNGLLSEGQPVISVSFDEMLFERTGNYELNYPLQASETPGVEGTAALDPETVRLSLSGSVLRDARLAGKSTARIVGMDEKEALIADYYKAAMESIMRDGSGQAVYLARIFLVQAVNSFLIDRIENVPFDQYVWNNVLESAVGQMMRKEFAGTGIGKNGAGTSAPGGGQDRGKGVQIAQGSVSVPIGAGQRGEKFFSSEVVHGLGLGNVTLLLGLEKEDKSVIYGSSEIFESEGKGGVDAEIAARQHPDSGSFVIGIRLLSSTLVDQATIHWTALRDMSSLVEEKSARSIFIKPNMLELSVRQSHPLEAVCENMVEKAVQWSVRDEGGTIDDDGLYTAPNVPGVYEIMAQSVAFPEVKASIFVIVREA